MHFKFGHWLEGCCCWCGMTNLLYLVSCFQRCSPWSLEFGAGGGRQCVINCCGCSQLHKWVCCKAIDLAEALWHQLCASSTEASHFHLLLYGRLRMWSMGCWNYVTDAQGCVVCSSIIFFLNICIHCQILYLIWLSFMHLFILVVPLLSCHLLDPREPLL